MYASVYKYLITHACLSQMLTDTHIYIYIYIYICKYNTFVYMCICTFAFISLTYAKQILFLDRRSCELPNVPVLSHERCRLDAGCALLPYVQGGHGVRLAQMFLFFVSGWGRGVAF